MSYTPTLSIQFWLDPASNYSYLSAMRIARNAARLGVGVDWRPFLLGPIFKAVGWVEVPFIQQKLKGAYVWQDMHRECQKYGLPWQKPSTFPRHSVLATRVAMLGTGQDWMPEFCRRVMTLNFGEDKDIATENDLRPVLEDLGLDAPDIFARAQSEGNRAALRRQTERALELGIFGGPTFIVGTSMFWGNDRLDDALELAATGRIAQHTNDMPSRLNMTLGPK